MRSIGSAAGAAPSPYAGIPISIKDLFDVAGQETRAGSRVLAGRPHATVDAPAVARLRAAGFVIVGRTNMTEFAYSGLGINAHYGTPRNPWQREQGRIPGGSSSGAAVGVADGMVSFGLGSDTGGSCRIPAALCGITGFKPTARRVPREGAVPLSSSLDSIGPLANSVACCAAIDAIIADASAQDAEQARSVPALPGLRAGLIGAYATDGMDDAVTGLESAERLAPVCN
jgi:aspartyl-tRNA(Asn)/glutamyl-tRNA(Gln) amidotransferase subunit A